MAGSSQLTHAVVRNCGLGNSPNRHLRIVVQNSPRVPSRRQTQVQPTNLPISTGYRVPDRESPSGFLQLPREAAVEIIVALFLALLPDTLVRKLVFFLVDCVSFFALPSLIRQKCQWLIWLTFSVADVTNLKEGKNKSIWW